jgi:hypothetical protein
MNYFGSERTEATSCEHDNKAGFVLERAVCDTERGDTEPGTAFVFTL